MNLDLPATYNDVMPISDPEALSAVIAGDNKNRTDRTWSAWFEFNTDESFEAALRELRTAVADNGARPDGGGRRLVVEFPHEQVRTVAEVTLRHAGAYQLPSPRIPRS